MLRLDAHDAGGHVAGVLVGELPDVLHVGLGGAVLEPQREVDDGAGAREAGDRAVYDLLEDGIRRGRRLTAEPLDRGVERLRVRRRAVTGSW